MDIVIWCTLFFDIVSTILEALVIAFRQFLYPFIVEWCRLLCTAVVTASLTSLSSWNHQPAGKDLRCRNKWKSIGAKSGLSGGIIELFPANCRDEILRCSVWAGVGMNYHNTLAKHATSFILDRAAQFLKCVAIDTCTDCKAFRQEAHKQNAFSVPKHCAHYLPS